MLYCFLSNIGKSLLTSPYILLVIPKRFERLTHALEGRCSIQLSYGTYLFAITDYCLFATAKIVRLFLCAKVFLHFFAQAAKRSTKRSAIYTFRNSFALYIILKIKNTITLLHSVSNTAYQSPIYCSVP